MDRRNPPRLQATKQVRRQEIHLFEEMLVVVCMAEVSEVRRILVLRRERDAGQDQVETVLFHVRRFDHTVIVDRHEITA